MYEKIFKRVLDFLLSLCALLALLPLFIILIVFGVVSMGGNPFFTQKRIGKNEKVFNLIKFRTMDNRKGKEGELLPDEVRLNKYGRILRASSLDELPELINILKGDMSIVGPRPLLSEYLPYYTSEERIRHSVRPGLSGLAQVNGRNFLSWEEIFAFDIEYAKNISFISDMKIIFGTIMKVFKYDDIADVSSVEKGIDGNLYVNVNGKRMKLHRPLNIEREENYYAK